MEGNRGVRGQRRVPRDARKRAGRVHGARGVARGGFAGERGLTDPASPVEKTAGSTLGWPAETARTASATTPRRDGDGARWVLTWVGMFPVLLPTPRVRGAAERDPLVARLRAFGFRVSTATFFSNLRISRFHRVESHRPTRNLLVKRPKNLWATVINPRANEAARNELLATDSLHLRHTDGAPSRSDRPTDVLARGARGA